MKARGNDQILLPISIHRIHRSLCSCSSRELFCTLKNLFPLEIWPIHVTQSDVEGLRDSTKYISVLEGCGSIKWNTLKGNPQHCRHFYEKVKGVWRGQGKAEKLEGRASFRGISCLSVMEFIKLHSMQNGLGGSYRQKKNDCCCPRESVANFIFIVGNVTQPTGFLLLFCTGSMNIVGRF
jgi:hypothetical protein